MVYGKIILYSRNTHVILGGLAMQLHKRTWTQVEVTFRIYSLNFGSDSHEGEMGQLYSPGIMH